MLWGTDAVHGHSNIPGATIFPHNVALGAARDPALIRRIGEITALEVRVTGLDWAFSPTVGRGPRRPLGPQLRELLGRPRSGTAPMRRPWCRGCRVRREPRSSWTVPTYWQPRNTSWAMAAPAGKDQGDNLVSEKELRDIDSAGYQAAIARRCPDRHGFLLQLAGPEDARQPGAAHRRTQGPHGLRRVRDRGLERARAAARLHPGSCAAAAIGPASTCSWRPMAGRNCTPTSLTQMSAGQIPAARWMTRCGASCA